MFLSVFRRQWCSALLLAPIASVACGGGGSGAPANTPAAADIAIDGSSTVFPVTEAVAEEFQALRERQDAELE